MDKNTEDIIRVASIDIGKKNFAQCIEESDLKVIEKLQEKYHNLPKKLQRRVKGPFTDEIKEIFDELSACSKVTHFGVFDLRHDKESNNLDMETRRNIMKHLESYNNLWAECDLIIIEQQFFNAFGRRPKTNGKAAEKAGGVNVDAIKISELVLVWFSIFHPTIEIITYGSRFKTDILGSPSGLNKPKRKAWTIEKFKEMSTLREDEDMIMLYDLVDQVKRKQIKTEERFRSFFDPFDGKSEDVKRLATQIIKEKQKMDDVSDTVTQSQAYKFHKFIAQF
ncbi:hypothetical protein OAG24_00590 [bacterium]|nr:hypothetical protein [bacterium]